MSIKVKIVQIANGEWDVFVAGDASHNDESVKDLVEKAVQTVLDSAALDSDCPTAFMPVDDGMQDGMRDLLIMADSESRI